MSSVVKQLFVWWFGQKPKVHRILRGCARGLKIRVSAADNMSVILGTNEPYLQALAKKYVAKGDVVLDVGANIGSFTLVFSRLVGRSGRVIAFEPIPDTAAQLRENLKLNDVANVTVIQRAVSDSDGSVTLRIPNNGKNISMASMHWHETDSQAVSVEVQSLALDHVDELKEVKPAFVKIDVEGAEGNVIQGMTELIRRSRPVIFVECSEIGRNIAWNALKSLNYSCYRACDIAVIENVSDYKHDDFLWLPQERPKQSVALKST